MALSRRNFMGLSAAACGALIPGLPGTALRRSLDRFERQEPQPLRLLFLGGTGFIGPHIVQAALDRGHTLTLFNRGRTNAHLFPEVEKLRGDRDGGLGVLEGRTWDAVIDTSGYVPRLVRASAEVLKDTVNHYLFVSSIAAYETFNFIGIEETAPLATLDDPNTEDVGAFYGPLKAQCERELAAVFPTRATVVRPTEVVGPGDRGNDFTYWVQRIHRGGEVLAPGDPSDPIQLIDVRDLADWVIRLIENATYGAYNAVGPESELSMAEFLYGIRAVTNAPTSFTWVDSDVLAEHDVYPWREIPMWWPPRDDYAGAPGRSIQGGTGIGLVSRTRALGAGLTYRPLAVTSKDTLDWFLSWTDPWESIGHPALTLEKEAEILARWHARQRG